MSERRGAAKFLPRVLVSLFLAACGGAAPHSGTAPAAVTPPRVVNAAPVAPSEEDADVPISTDNPSWGSRTALVTIVEFADLECPFCARVEATLGQIRETYGPETVRIVWKNSPLPFHPHARPAAEAAMGVFAMGGSGAFWQFCLSALGAQNRLEPDAFDQWAKAAGIGDGAAFRAGMARHEWARAIERDEGDARSLGVMGTPSFFVNGLPLAGALPFVTFQMLIDEQVRKAQEKLHAGTARERLYADLTHENRVKAAAQAKDDDASEEDDAKTVFKVPVGKSPVRGSPRALVTVIEFADYQCPFCVRVEPTLEALRDEYGDKLRIAFKDSPLPFHERAEPAAEAALEVRAERGDAAFWSMHDELLTAAPDRDLGDSALTALAARFGGQPAMVKAAIAERRHRQAIEGDVDLAEDFDANGTPHFFINGRRVVGAQPREKFEEVINEEIERAQGLLQGGTRPEAIYDALVHDGKEAPPPEQKVLPASLGDHSPGRGRSGAKVTVHEWSDFQCPFCKRAEPTLEQLVREYGNNLRLVWHDLPLPMHPSARLAAGAAREAMAQKGEWAFWSMHDEIFAHQDHLTRDALDGYARSLGLDMERWSKALDGDAHAQEIDADMAVAQGLSIEGTPGFVVAPAGAKSGYFIAGAQSYSKFRRLVERSLAEAK